MNFISTVSEHITTISALFIIYSSLIFKQQFTCVFSLFILYALIYLHLTLILTLGPGIDPKFALDINPKFGCDWFSVAHR